MNLYETKHEEFKEVANRSCKKVKQAANNWPPGREAANHHKSQTEWNVLRSSFSLIVVERISFLHQSKY